MNRTLLAPSLPTTALLVLTLLCVAIPAAAQDAPQPTIVLRHYGSLDEPTGADGDGMFRDEFELVAPEPGTLVITVASPDFVPFITAGGYSSSAVHRDVHDGRAGVTTLRVPVVAGERVTVVVSEDDRGRVGAPGTARATDAAYILVATLGGYAAPVALVVGGEVRG